MQRENAILLRSARVHAGRRSHESDANGSVLVDLVHGDVDWEYVADYAWMHGVTPLVYRSLSNLPAGRVPAGVLEGLREAFHKQGLMIHVQVRELHNVQEALAARDVPVIVFKGPALGAQAYGNPMLRKPGDLDVLIRKEHFSTARTVLEAQGYRGQVRRQDEEEYLRTRGGVAFIRGSFQVDLHWTLEQRRFDSLPFSFRLSSEAVRRDALEVQVQGRSVRTLSPQHHLLFLCFHGAKHFWQRLYLLCDIAELIRSHPELAWDDVLAHARDLKMTRILHLGVHLAHRHLDAPVPDSVVRAIHDDESVDVSARRAGHQLFEPHEAGLDSHLFRMGMLESLPDKISYVFNRSWRKISKLDWSI